MAAENKTNITFAIKEIKTLKFIINNLPEAFNIDKEKFQFQIFPASFLDYDNKTIGFDIIIIVFIETPTRTNVCELINRVSFDIKNLYDFVPAEDKLNPKIPDNFMHTLLSISLSTSRGILFAKTEGSALSNVYLPVLNPTSFKPIEKPKEIIK